MAKLTEAHGDNIPASIEAEARTVEEAVEEVAVAEE
jgi:hypothetical protein